MKYLFIVNEGAYGSELPYNALRLAMALQKEHQADISMFFLGDGVTAAMNNQQTPNGYYNLERMMKAVIAKKGIVKLCGTCLDARGIKDENIVQGAKRSTMAELALLTEEADKVLTF